MARSRRSRVMWTNFSGGEIFGMGLVGMAVWMTIDALLYRRQKGGFRRGVPVWITRAPALAVEELQALASRGPTTIERSWGWFRVDGDQALVMAKLNPAGAGFPTLRRTSWPYVVRVRLDDGRMEYRTPTSSALFLLGFVLFPLRIQGLLDGHAGDG